MYDIYTKTHGKQLFLQGLEGLAGLEMVFGGWLDMTWDLEVVFWRLMIGFGWFGVDFTESWGTKFVGLWQP